MSFFALSKEETIALSKQQSMEQEVELSCINFNWGAPVSGRTDTDGMVISAKVNADFTGKLYLQGTKDNLNWDIDMEFEKMGSYSETDGDTKYVLYTLDLVMQDTFPEEFVLRFDTKDESFYDNNEGMNFKIKPYSGIGGSAYALEEDAIIDLGEIVNPNLYLKVVKSK